MSDPLLPIATTSPPVHIVRWAGKQVAIERRRVGVDRYSMPVEDFKRNLDAALEDCGDDAINTLIEFEVEQDWSDTYTFTCMVSWYRPATKEDRDANKKWERDRQKAMQAAEQARVREFVERNPDLARSVLSEVETAAQNNQGGRG